MAKNELYSPTQVTVFEDADARYVTFTRKTQVLHRVPIFSILFVLLLLSGTGTVVFTFLNQEDLPHESPSSDVTSASMEMPVKTDMIVSEDISSAPEQSLQPASLALLLDSGYIFPDTSTKLLTQMEIASIQGNERYSKEEMLQFAINELYARNHYEFQEKEFQVFYGSYSWYENYGYSAENAIAHFNNIEIENLDALVRYRDTP